MTGKVWCSWHRIPAAQCAQQDDGAEHCANVVSPLGYDDEPRRNGALVVVWAGDYRGQEVWVASGANIGNWYCLGNEFYRPKVWDPPQPQWPDTLNPSRGPTPKRPEGTIPRQPDWGDVLSRGPVSLLVAGGGQAYQDGWANGRRALASEIESLAEDGPPDTGGY